VKILPKYLYQCKCGNQIEVNCKMSEYSPTTKCEYGEMAERKADDLGCGLSIDGTGAFYRKTN
jgi:predicted nucleic acid-binding Zn ribbon protein